MEKRIFAKNILINGEWLENRSVLIRDGLIADIEGSFLGDPYEYVSAGLIDNHIHGGVGFTVTQSTVQEMEKWLYEMARRGVCGVCAATYGDKASVRSALAVARTVMERQGAGDAGGAELLGIHMEGPFLNSERCGSMEVDTLVRPDIGTYLDYTDGYGDTVKEVSLAPELDEAHALIKHLRKNGIRVLAGHTDCEYGEAKNAFLDGVGATCHTFNAMHPILHRAPGIASAALADDGIYCEMICDLIHLHEGTVKLLYKCKGAQRLMIISDAVEPTGLSDGVFTVDSTKVYVKNGEPRTEDGTLYGGGCFISESVRRLYAVGIPAKDILLMASDTPARWLGLSDWDIKIGNKARLTCFDSELRLCATYIGNEVFIP